MNDIDLPSHECLVCGHEEAEHSAGRDQCTVTGCQCTAYVGPPTAVVHHEPAPVAIAHLAQNPLDLDPAVFQAALDRRRVNRDALLNWIRAQLKEGVDYGKIHVVSKAKCDLGKDCKNERHFSTPSLFKPGAEKIVGILGLSPRFPTLAQYEAAAVAGVEIKQIILRCELLDTSGRVVGAGVGARYTSQDSGDLNKSLKMAKKSAYIDAAITGAGLSDEYTLDVEDMRLGEDLDAAGYGPSGHPGELFPPPEGSPPARAPQPAKATTGELCPCGSPCVEAKTGAKAKRPHTAYITCDLSNRAFKGDAESKRLLAIWDAENPDTKHTWRYK